MVGDHLRNTLGIRESSRCGAKIRRDSLCRAAAVAGKKRCRMHGGAAGWDAATVFRLARCRTDQRRLRHPVP